MRVILYTREGCGLCDEIHTYLLDMGIEPALVDISTDPALERDLGERIPVVDVDGQRFTAPINRDALRNALS